MRDYGYQRARQGVPYSRNACTGPIPTAMLDDIRTLLRETKRTKLLNSGSAIFAKFLAVRLPDSRSI